MVQEMIAKVQDAETKASEIIKEAEKNSVSLVESAKAKGAEIKEKYRKNALEQGENILAQKKHEYEEKEGTVNRQIEEEVAAITRDAKLNESKAIEAVIASFY